MQIQREISTLTGAIIIIIAAVVLFGGAFAWQYYLKLKINQPENQTACTMEAKQCPDGSYVGRTGPNCEFADCLDQTTSWETYKNVEYGFEIKLPPSWEGYSINNNTAWEGVIVDAPGSEGPDYSGPVVTLKNPKTTAREAWQDIPIMVITPEVWKLILEGKVSVSAAPVGPEKIGQNSKYIFATPPRWYGFTDAKGWEEAVKAVETFKSAEPSITIVSPAGAEIWKVGETHSITWTSSNLSSVQNTTPSVIIQLMNITDRWTYPLATIPAYEGTYFWKIPSVLTSNNGTFKVGEFGKRYGIIVSQELINVSANPNVVVSRSNDFSILPALNGNITNWKTYRGYGISFKYPNSIEKPKVTQLSTRTVIAFDRADFSVGVYYNQSLGRNETSDEIINGIKSRSDIFSVEQDSIVVDGKNGIILYYTSMSGSRIIEIFIPNIDQRGNMLHGYSYLRKAEVDILEILKTLKFTK